MLPADEINNPDSCLNRAGVDEPVFVFRAKDPLAVLIVNYWIGLAEAQSLHHDRIDEAKEWVNKAIYWQYRQTDSRISRNAFTASLAAGEEKIVRVDY